MVGSTVEENVEERQYEELDDLAHEHARHCRALEPSRRLTRVVAATAIRRSPRRSGARRRPRGSPAAAPSGTCPSAPSTPSSETLVPVRRVRRRPARRRSTSSFAGGPYTSTAVPRVLGDELRRRPAACTPVRHDQNGVGQALRLLDVVGRHEIVVLRAQRRSAPTAPGAPADRGRRSARRAARRGRWTSARAIRRRRRMPPDSLSTRSLRCRAGWPS